MKLLEFLEEISRTCADTCPYGAHVGDCAECEEAFAIATKLEGSK